MGGGAHWKELREAVNDSKDDRLKCGHFFRSLAVYTRHGNSNGSPEKSRPLLPGNAHLSAGCDSLGQLRSRFRLRSRVWQALASLQWRHAPRKRELEDDG